MDGNMIILITTVVGGLIIGLGAFKGSRKNIRDAKADLDELRDTIRVQNSELSKKDAEIQSMAKEILSFSKNIDTNTNALQRIADGITGVTKNTNDILKLSTDELREKGEFALRLPTAERYKILIGGNMFDIPHENLVQGFTLPRVPVPIPFVLKLKGDNLLISANILREDGDIIALVNQNNWSINRKLCFSVNYDASGLEVLDTKGFVVFQVLIKNDELNVALIGYQSKGVVILTPEKRKIILFNDPKYFEKLYESRNLIIPSFKHWGSDYLHKRVENF